MFVNDIQIAYAKSILLIERNLEPTCHACGVKVDRSKCYQDLGGYCNRFNQEDTIKYKSVISQLEVDSGLNRLFNWRYEIPLNKLIELTNTEYQLCLDLKDKLDSGWEGDRIIDNRYDNLSSKGVTYTSVKTLWKIDFTKRGRALIDSMIKERSE